ncbi:lipopolysaccharide core biosynthesis protein [Salmonella bongori]|nr:lipopolysaccharide core biosynthesis protein [Salmonella bongori]
MEKPFRRILIIKMRFHGDMLLTTPVISTLKQNYPDAKNRCASLPEHHTDIVENPEINALYGISNKGTEQKEKIKNALSLVKNCVLITMTWSSISPINGVWRLLCVF